MKSVLRISTRLPGVLIVAGTLGSLASMGFVYLFFWMAFSERRQTGIPSPVDTFPSSVLKKPGPAFPTNPKPLPKATVPLLERPSLNPPSQSKASPVVIVEQPKPSVPVVVVPVKEVPGVPPADKPLFLGDLMVRMNIMSAEWKTVNRLRNENVTAKLAEQHETERRSWVGKTVRGIGQAVQVNQQEVQMYNMLDATHSFYIFTTAKDAKNPLLSTLIAGQIVQFEGILKQEFNPVNIAVHMKQCTYTLKK